jgi:hypothetical protein
MTWLAFYQADGEMRHEIGTYKTQHRAEFERDKFVERMSNPGAQIFWTWIECDEKPETLDEVLARLGIVWVTGKEGPFGY